MILSPWQSPGPDAVVVGTGRVTLDVVVRKGQARSEARSQAGGTCGNVLINLACLGWEAYPLADLGDDEPGRSFSRDLARWGVHLDLIEHYPDQESPVIIHLLEEGTEGIRHSFTSACPFCGRMLKYYEPVPLPHLKDRLARLPPAKVFFFDRDSPGSLRLARMYREQGALVMYETNYAGPESQLAEALAVSHVVKFAAEKLSELAEHHPLAGPWLLIETRGEQGLRYRDQRRTGAATWQSLPAFRVTRVRDAGGAGDWCTAGLLHLLARGGAAEFLRNSAEQLREALTFGQALGAWNCAFEGARGGMYQVSRKTWQRDVDRILRREVFDPEASSSASTLDLAGAFCRGCSSTPELDHRTVSNHSGSTGDAE
ncbi:MAG: PfkB family carbohydrate kinase [Gemmataceae bacterium]